MKKGLIILLIIAIAIRLLGINNALFFDENTLVTFLVSDADSWDPPLYLWMLHFFTYIFGLKVWAMRFTSCFFNILSIILIYAIAKKIYDKKTAFLSVFLISISFFSIINALQISDESLQIFLYLACFLSYIKFEEGNKKIWLAITGLFLGLAFLTKYSTILFLIVLASYIILKNSFKKSIKAISLICIIAITVFSIFPLYYLLTNPASFYKTIELLINNIENPFSLPILARALILFLWATPLLIGFSIISFFNLKKRDYILVIWILFVSAFNFIFLRYGDIPRYFMMIIPPMILLSANFISKLKINKKELFIGIFSFFFFYFMFFLVNKTAIIKYPHILSYYLLQIKSFNFNFMLPYAISEGSWFGVSFYNILISVFLFVFFMIVIIILAVKNKFDFNKIKLILILFLSLGLAYNIFLDGEYLLHLSQPDVDKVIKEMVDYANNNNLKPIYVSDRGFLDYLYSYEEYPNRAELSRYRIDERAGFNNMDEKIKEGDNIFFVNFAAKIKKEEIDKIDHCKLLKTFSDKGINIGYIYSC